MNNDSNFTFYIYNYLKKPIKLVGLLTTDHGLTTEKPKVISESIPPGGRVSITRFQVEEFMRRYNKIRIFVKDVRRSGQPPKEELFADYVFSRLPEGETIKALHIGMITSRMVQTNSMDTNNWALPNAIQGLPWVKIHNMTNRFIGINNNISMNPRQTIQYAGRHKFGVALGTIFRDRLGIFPDYQYTVPNTDIYYGVVSDIQQPLNGGWQLDSVFLDDSFEPQYLLNNGWVGGPAEGNIPYGYIPEDGPSTLLYDEWGELIGGKDDLVNGYFPPNNSSMKALPSKCYRSMQQ